MKDYKVVIHVEDIITTENEKEAEKIFWDRFDNSTWKAKVIKI